MGGRSGWKPRIEERYRIELDARVRNEGSFSWIEAQLINLSRSGACIHTRAQLDQRRPVEIEIPIYEPNRLREFRRLTADVIWRRGYRFGLKFRKAAPASKSGS